MTDATISEYVEQIRTAVTLKEVKTAIAEALEYCYENVAGTSRTKDTDSEMETLIYKIETETKGSEIRESIAAGIELCCQSIALFAPTSDGDRKIEAGYVQQIRDSVFGKDARSSIADAIEFCWDEWESIPVATASGSVVTFDDGIELPVKSLSVAIEPVQDLHGYDSPWPEGGSKNIFDSAVLSGVSSYTVNDDESITVNGSDGRAWSNISAFAFPAGTYTISKTPTIGNVQLKFSTDNFDSTVVCTDTATFTVTEACTAKMKVAPSGVAYPITFKIQIEVGNTATSWAKHGANICPISGFDSVKVTRTGRNLLDKNEAVANERFNTAGTASYTNNYRSGYTPVKPSTAYYFKSVRGTAFMMPVFWFDKDKTFISYQNVGASDPSSGVLTSPAKAAYVGVNFAPEYLDSVAINYPATATDYEPYQGQTYSIALPSQAGTVYGGKLTVNEDGTGTLVVDRASVDMGTLTWRYTDSYGNNLFCTNSIVDMPARASLMCSRYLYAGVITSSSSFDDIANNTIVKWGGASRVYLVDPAFTDAASFTSAMSGVQLVYELATPITYTLTASQVRTLTGSNNIWADTGDVAVTYRTNTEGRTQIVTKSIDLYMVRGDTFGFYVVLSDVDTSKIQAVTFTVKKYATDSTPIIQKTLGNGIEASSDPENSYRVRVAPEDTSGISAGKYVYDIEINVAGDIYTVLAGNLEIKQDVTTH